MTQSGVLTRLSHGLTSKRGARISLVAVLVGVIALFGLLSGAEAPGGNAQAPVTAESARAAEILKTFPNADVQPVLVVATRTVGGPLSAADQEQLAQLAPQLTQLDDQAASGPLMSDDGQAGILVVPVPAGGDIPRAPPAWHSFGPTWQATPKRG